jgi:hypothetical protein
MSEEFDFYEGNEEGIEEVRDIKGLTDTVSKYVYSNMEFPCICLKEDIKLPRHKWVIISKLVKQGSSDKNISIYMLRGGEVFKAGTLSGLQVKAFIDIIGLDNLFGYFNKDKKLTGDRLYVLSC